LELTWIGKDDRPRLEPRILPEDPEKSYHATNFPLGVATHFSLNATQQVVYREGTSLVAYSWYVQRIVGSDGSTQVLL
jgi:hypothetical protein